MKKFTNKSHSAILTHAIQTNKFEDATFVSDLEPEQFIKPNKVIRGICFVYFECDGWTFVIRASDFNKLKRTKI